MANTTVETFTNDLQTGEDRLKELKALDDSKAGVKGLVDAGAKTIPKIFIRPPEELSEDLKTPLVHLQVPVIDLSGIDEEDRYSEIVKEVVKAAEEWGFFQVVNHGVPVEVLDRMIEAIRMYHEQDAEAKKLHYTRDFTKQVIFLTNYDLYKSHTANWRDSFIINALYSDLDPQELPDICRDVMMEYINHALKLSDILFQLISVGLGLRPDHLKEMDCNKGWSLINHYYPACPEPELTLGNSRHTDPTSLTVLLQDQIGGLQVLHQNQWVDIHPIHGAFVVNIGDMLQIMSNDKLNSVYHRVTANRIGPRISAALLFQGHLSSPKSCGPIKDLLSDENKPVYRELTTTEFTSHFFSRPLDVSSHEFFKTQNDGDCK